MIFNTWRPWAAFKLLKLARHNSLLGRLGVTMLHALNYKPRAEIVINSGPNGAPMGLHWGSNGAPMGGEMGETNLSHLLVFLVFLVICYGIFRF